MNSSRILAVHIIALAVMFSPSAIFAEQTYQQSETKVIDDLKEEIRKLKEEIEKIKQELDARKANAERKQAARAKARQATESPQTSAE